MREEYCVKVRPMLKIQRSANGKVVFALSGRIEMEDVTELERLLALETVDHRLVLDLKEVTLVHRDAVKFLANCESNGTELQNCPAYIRSWIVTERNSDSPA